jgi:hypothetical protein
MTVTQPGKARGLPAVKNILHYRISQANKGGR